MIDEAEDGARAILVEEGIATWIFNHAQRLAFFEDLEALDYGLLKAVRDFVRAMRPSAVRFGCGRKRSCMGIMSFEPSA